MPTKEQVKALMSNSKAQDRLINALDELLKTIEKPASPVCPPGIPPQLCSEFQMPVNFPAIPENVEY